MNRVYNTRMNNTTYIPSDLLDLSLERAKELSVTRGTMYVVTTYDEVNGEWQYATTPTLSMDHTIVARFTDGKSVRLAEAE